LRRLTVFLALAACDGPASTDFGRRGDTAAETDARDSEPAPVDTVDDDGDGVVASLDCDDADPLVHPAAPERCDGVDDDCDGQIDKDAVPLASPAYFGPLYLDRDADGWGDEHSETWFCVDPGSGWVREPGDCDDLDPTVRPDADEGCPDPVHTCGDHGLEPGEACDDGNTADGDGCTARCGKEFCGDGVVQAGLGEGCDDGDHRSGDGCDVACRVEVCGDGVVQPGLGETCDDGGTAGGDGCAADCTSESCGDGEVQAQWGEACDDGGRADDDGCSSWCRLEGCGDAVVDPGERCDDGNRADGDGCSSVCLLERFRITPVRAEVSPTEITSGLTWDLLAGDEPADVFVTARVDGRLRFRTATVAQDDTPAWSAVYEVELQPGQVLELVLADFDATTEPDLIGTWLFDHGQLNASVDRTLDLTGPMVTTFQVRVQASF
jgi:cysteine-rich repeat protein